MGLNQKTRTEEAFQIEMNAKNQAYAFILSNGLLDRFAQFCKENSRTENRHPFCIEVLKEIVTRNEN